MNRNRYGNLPPEIQDFGPDPLIINIDRATKMNNNFRTALWTGDHLQVTLMSIPAGGDIGIEMHSHLDQFIRIESGRAIVLMGRNRNALREEMRVDGNYAVIIPAGTWHNVINAGVTPLKLYSIYAPPQHPFGTVQRTKEEAEAEERRY